MSIFGLAPTYSFITGLSLVSATILLIAKALVPTVSWWWVLGLASPAILLLTILALAEIADALLKSRSKK